MAPDYEHEEWLRDEAARKAAKEKVKKPAPKKADDEKKVEPPDETSDRVCGGEMGERKQPRRNVGAVFYFTLTLSEEEEVLEPAEAVIQDAYERSSDACVRSRGAEDDDSRAHIERIRCRRNAVHTEDRCGIRRYRRRSQLTDRMNRECLPVDRGHDPGARCADHIEDCALHEGEVMDLLGGHDRTVQFSADNHAIANAKVADHSRAEVTSEARVRSVDSVDRAVGTLDCYLRAVDRRDVASDSCGALYRVQRA